MISERFSEHVRSASFALTLSAAQIDEVLKLDLIPRLIAKYPWYLNSRTVNFGSAEEAAVQWTNSTVRALARKGLVDVVVVPLPTSKWDVVRLTEPGRLTAAMLLTAGFEPRLFSHEQVTPHPDDRIILRPTGDGFETVPSQGDRRDPSDAKWCTPFLRSTVSA